VIGHKVQKKAREAMPTGSETSQEDKGEGQAGKKPLQAGLSPSVSTVEERGEKINA